MPRASLAMYDSVSPVQAANDRIWQGIRDRLRAAGYEAPEALDRVISYDGIWLQPDLMLAQTCGYPYVSQLKGKVRLVATPVFDFAGGKGTERVSFIIVADSCEAESLEDLRGAVASVNDWGSNSGMNLFRAAIMPLARDGKFFSRIHISGGHLPSIKAVQDGQADVASIDTVTWGMLARHRPDMLKGVRILAESPSGPGLPYITRLDASDAEVEALRKAIADTIADPAYAGAVSALGLTGIEVLTDEDYDRLDAYRREAERLGYPIIA
ncbi:MAG: phosphate transporter substrate-binding protein [Rhizobium sp.]|nr:phosphate transporter substrate-binding protein [Rhizobium sp.]